MVVVVGILVVNYFRKLPESPDEPTISGDVSLSGITNEDGNLKETHQVKEGETLWEVSEEYYGTGYDWKKIAEENDLVNPNNIEEGQELVIPSPTPKEIPQGEVETTPAPKVNKTYTVVHGDTLWSIAEAAYGNPYRWVDIASTNHLTNPNLIHPGNTFTIPE